VRLADFQSSGVQLTFPVNTKTLGDHYSAASDIREGILKAFAENKIVIPYQTVQIINRSCE
jgi:small-conductance mechanosensitive channel